MDDKRCPRRCFGFGFGFDDLNSSSYSKSSRPLNLFILVIFLTTLLILVRTLSRHFQPIFIRFTVLFSSVPSRIVLSIPLTTSFSALSRFLSSALSFNPQSLALLFSPFFRFSSAYACFNASFRDCAVLFSPESERMILGHRSLSPGHWKPWMVVVQELQFIFPTIDDDVNFYNCHTPSLGSQRRT